MTELKKKEANQGIQFGNMQMLTPYEILGTPRTHNPIITS
jgi:hypothetical protein